MITRLLYKDAEPYANANDDVVVLMQMNRV